MTLPTSCRVTGNVATIGLVPAAGLALLIAPEPQAVRRAGDVVIVPEPVTVTVDALGDVDVSLVPGRYSVSARQASTVFARFLITVPSASVGILAQLIDAPPPATLNAAQLAVLDAQSARDAANASAVAADADRVDAEAAKVAAEAARDTARDWKDDAADSAAAALASQSAAAASQTAAAGSASSASASAATATTQAGLSATARTGAEAARDAAAASQGAAAGSATAAAASASQAATSETNAASSKDGALAAKTASEAARDASVTAKLASQAAQTAAETARAGSEAARDAAAASQTAAAGSASTASTQAGIATTQAGVATTKAGEAASSATAAATAKTAAEAARDSATASAGTATTKASEASASAAAALVSKNAAATSATNAATSETNINTSYGAMGTLVTKADEAAASAASASSSKDAAALSASSAGQSALIASTYSVASGLDTATKNAQAAASLAQGYAASAASVVTQDLSGVSAQALHRSPNAITSMFVYDTSRDSDGGAWTKKCQHTSWYNEPLAGKWLGAQPSEAYARYQNASVGSSLGDPYASATGYTVSSGSLPIISNGWLAFNPGVGSAWTSKDYTTVSGRTYRLTGTFRRSATNVNIFAGTGGGAATFGSISLSASGAFVFYFTATGATSNVGMQSVGGTLVEIQLGALVEVTALNTSSNDYFQLSTDGKFYRLWKNLLKWSSDFSQSSAWALVSSTLSGSVGSQAIKLNNGVTDSKSGITQTVSMTVGADYTLSAEVGTSGARYVLLSFDNSAGFTSQAWFDLQSATVGDRINHPSFASNVTSAISAGSAAGRSYISMTFKSLVGGAYVVRVTTSATAPGVSGYQFTVTNDGVQTLAVYSAQLEFGTARTALEAKAADGSTTEIFRGNKAEFPKLAAIVAEASNVTIYDLTEAGRPMWMRFVASGTTSVATSRALLGPNSQSAVAAQNGIVATSATSNSGYQGSLVNFPADAVPYLTNGVAGSFRGNIAQRNDALGFSSVGGYSTIAGTSINAIAMTTLPDAPIDPATGLRVPTIAVATNGGVSVIKHNGTVVSSASTAAATKVLLDYRDLIWLNSTGALQASNPGNLAASFAASRTYNNSSGPAILGTPTLVAA